MITGHHVRRTALPGPAGLPGCSSSHLLVPLWHQPHICVLSWSGEILQTLGPAELGIQNDDYSNAVSPIQEGLLHFWVVTDEGHQVNTYKVTICLISVWFIILIRRNAEYISSFIVISQRFCISGILKGVNISDENKQTTDRAIYLFLLINLRLRGNHIIGATY